jgi:hypothetical protein
MEVEMESSHIRKGRIIMVVGIMGITEASSGVGLEYTMAEAVQVVEVVDAMVAAEAVEEEEGVVECC